MGLKVGQKAMVQNANFGLLLNHGSDSEVSFSCPVVGQLLAYFRNLIQKSTKSWNIVFKNIEIFKKLKKTVQNVGLFL
jgi:hypothetical protein